MALLNNKTAGLDIGTFGPLIGVATPTRQKVPARLKRMIEFRKALESRHAAG
jgi:hypothetical protein